MTNIPILIPVKFVLSVARWAMTITAIILSLFAASPLLAQTAAGEKASIESRFIVDMPTAGVLSKKQYSVNIWAFGYSGVAVDFSIAPVTNLELGMSYSGAGFLGNQSMVFQGLPGFHLVWRPLDETLTAPGVVVGINTQGRGYPKAYNDSFETLSPGFYIAASKNFSLWGSAALHVGVNYSLESPSGYKVPNGYVGFEKTLGSLMSLAVEYNATFNDPSTKGGLLNAGLRISTGKGFTFELQVRDILKRMSNNVYRMLRVEYVAGY